MYKKSVMHVESCCKLPVIAADCTLSSVSIEPWVSRSGENRGRIATPTPRLKTEPNSFAPAHCKKFQAKHFGQKNYQFAHGLNDG